VEAHLREHRDGQLEWLEWSDGDLNVAFSTRRGGVSDGCYESLNVGFAVGDDSVRVRRNRELLCAAVGVALDDLVVPAQVHGKHIRAIGSGDRGRGALSPQTAVPNTDGLVTNVPGVPLAVGYADCLAVIVAAHEAGGCAGLALVHAGWRGLMDGIVARAVRRVWEYGPADFALIGPSIGSCCFVVDEALAMRFAERFGAEVVTNLADGWHVDLWGCAVGELRASGVASEAIDVAGICTSCDARFYSHRRDRGATGRQAAIAWIGPRRRSV
jgi:YfiH family protein